MPCQLDYNMNVRIKVWLNFVRAKPGDLISRANGVYLGLKDNPHFPNLPFDISELRVAIDTYTASHVEAMDGGKRAIAQSKHDRDLLVHNLRTLAHYVEANCRGNMEIFRLSGFDPAPTGRLIPPPFSHTIRSIKPGRNSGSMIVKLVADREAFHYRLRYAAVNTADEWTVINVINTRPASLIKDLIPGVTYAFQVSALHENAYTDWSDSVTMLCT